MSDTKLTKEQKLLFDVYSLGVQFKDCNLDEYVERFKKLLITPDNIVEFLKIEAAKLNIEYDKAKIIIEHDNVKDCDRLCITYENGHLARCFPIK